MPFSTFELMLQTGAFLQLTLILTALVSRLDILISELQMVLQNLDDTLSKLIDALVSIGCFIIVSKAQ